MVDHHWKKEVDTTFWTLRYGLGEKLFSDQTLLTETGWVINTHTHTHTHTHYAKVNNDNHQGLLCHCLFEVGWVWPRLAAAKSNWD